MLLLFHKSASQTCCSYDSNNLTTVEIYFKLSLFGFVDHQTHYLLMDLKKCCCPGHHTPTLCSSALEVAPAEGWCTSQWASADHRCTWARRSPLPPGSGRAGHRNVEIPAPPPASGHLSHSPARSDLRTAKGGGRGGNVMCAKVPRSLLHHL